jgi:hypothetical protein
MNRHNINLLAYLAFTAFTVLVVVGYQQHTNSRFAAADRISCANRQILIENQRVVLDVLERNVSEFVNIATNKVHRAYFQRSLQLLKTATVELDGTPQCHDRKSPSHLTPHP